jgi:hypothetical protein
MCPLISPFPTEPICISCLRRRTATAYG